VYSWLYIPACIGSGIVAVVSFFLYIRYRVKPRSEDPQPSPGDQRLEKLEQRYQQIHFVSLSLFVLFGVLILIELSHRYNPPRIGY
jgi:hypothetical protein